jgi:hypothetical protein
VLPAQRSLLIGLAQKKINCLKSGLAICRKYRSPIFFWILELKNHVESMAYLSINLSLWHAPMILRI